MMRAALWAQYWTWGPGVALGDNERYLSQPADFNNAWTRAYANALADLKFLEKSSDKTYNGISKIMQANLFQILVDHFGDIPFTEAIKGEIVDGANFAPKYDDDKAVYAALIPMINAGIADLKAGSTTVGSADLMFGGDVSKWIKFGNSLKLRILMRQSVTGDQAAIGQAVKI
ncbi:MAG: SusD/RagB family nutrient-binding outer membrane lipoprotein [Saprospiraceae bacterium]|nr:SusD/RagB family nutrient-binding outer membrane lipoprotein [Saprospiraceae bacterium]